MKLEKATPFIDKVIKFVKANPKINSIDEVVHIFKDQFENTVCTKTIYNYVHNDLIELKKMDCQEIVGRKQRNKHPQAKRKMGTSIEQRPVEVETRKVFGHWEGDLVIGSNDKRFGALFTLVERKTRFQIAIPIKNQTAKQVFMAINKIHKDFGDKFMDIFQSITFDNGTEFYRFKDIEKHPKQKYQRTQVFFAHAYCSYERGTNENGNRMIRRFFPKGTNFNELSVEEVIQAIDAINQKHRRILDYQTAKDFFDAEVNKIFS